MNKLLLILGTFLTLHAGPALAAERLNFILVLTDDVGLSRIGCYGGAPFRTPHLDRLAAKGLRFERCYSMPICGPSRAALLTGKYPFHTGAVNNNTSVIDPQRHPTIANVLREAGYATCAVGKLGQSAPENDPHAPRELGFDEFMLWMGRNTPDRYWSPRYCRNGEFVQGEADEYGPDQTHEFMIDFLKRRREQPFFVYYSAVLAHTPIVRTPETQPGVKDPKQLVVDMVEYLDTLMGRLAEDLDRLGLRDNTIILFTSDNGPFGDPLGKIRGAPMLGGKGDVTEGGVREPLIVNCPGLVPAGRVCADLTDFTDFFPTLLELAEIQPPAGLKLDGRSIAPQILGKPGTPRAWVYAQHGREYFIADDRYKLYGDGVFVDISESPVVEKPVAADSAVAAEARQQLTAALRELRAHVKTSQDARSSPPRVKAPPTPEQLQEDLRLLAEMKLIFKADDWLGRSEFAGEQVAALLVKASDQFQPGTTTVDQAIAVLQAQEVINSAAYWREHAMAGQTCNADNVGRLIHKLAAKLRR